MSLLLLLCAVGGSGSGSGLQTDNTTEGECGAEKGTDLSQVSATQCGETRLTFHTSLEVPQLRQWFRVNPKPSDRMLLKYAQLLNQSSLRQERYILHIMFILYYVHIIHIHIHILLTLIAFTNTYFQLFWSNYTLGNF